MPVALLQVGERPPFLVPLSRTGVTFLLPGRDTRPVYVLARLPLETVKS